MADEPDPDRDSPAVDIRVTRSGGVAGMRRGWAVASPDARRWEPLVDACPWDDDGPGLLVRDDGPDRMLWRIEVLAPGPARSAELPESAVEGPWRALVETVRDEGS
ncbi:hypothetical protein FJ656_31440, partial [Schumannella luteola]